MFRIWSLREGQVGTSPSHSYQNRDSTMRFYDLKAQIDKNDSTILLSRIYDFTI
jgi:hypothetical protein